MREWGRPPKADKLARKLTKKTMRPLPEGSTGFLVIYDHSSWAEELRPLFDEQRPDIETVIATFPNLAGVAFVHPFTSHRLDLEESLKREDRVFIRHTLPGTEAEALVVWRNPIGENAAFRLVLECFAEFPSNLKRWDI